MNALPLAGASKHAVYTGRTTSWPMVAATSVGALFVAVSAKSTDEAWPDPWFMIPLLLVATGVVAEILTASSVRATAGPNGFTIRWGLIGWPRCSYSIDEIAGAEVIDLPWWFVSWGFWWTPRRTCCTVRSGPTVRLSLCSGRTVTVTVPEPEAAVAALRQAMAAGGSASTDIAPD